MVTGSNAGGLLVKTAEEESLFGFMPFSQMSVGLRVWLGNMEKEFLEKPGKAPVSEKPVEREGEGDGRPVDPKRAARQAALTVLLGEPIFVRLLSVDPVR